MERENMYGKNSLERDFPNEEACLQFVFDSQHTRKCSCGGQYHLISGRKQFQCSKCRFQIAPCADTIFHKSSTPLLLWFHAIWIFSNAKSGISALEMQRQLEVTYKCAWRILSLIRKALKQDSDTKLNGDIEMDSAYFGGRKYGGKNNENLSEAIAAKSVVMAAVQRNGEMRAELVKDNGAKTHADFINKYIEKNGSRLLTDGSNKYKKAVFGLSHESVDHRSEYVRGDVHINRIETFWSHVKRSIRGTHKAISQEHLQSYLDAFVFHYNNRYSDKKRFASLVGMLLHA